jgi:hypothetical protein
MSNNHFSVLDNVKNLPKYISNNVSFKICYQGNTCLYWHWLTLNINPVFLFWNWNDRIKMIVLPSFQLAARLNSQNTNETEFINELLHINLFMNIGISNWHNWIFDLTKIFFLNLFQFLTTITELQAPKTLYSIPRGAKWNDVKNVLFSSSKFEKKKSWKIKTKCVTDFLLTVRSSSMKNYTCH